MTWVWAVMSVIGCLISLSGAVLVHIRAYDLQKRVENLEDRQQSIRARVYQELQKNRDEIAKEVESYLEAKEPASQSSGPDIGEALLMQMMGMGMMGQQQRQEPATREEAIHEILIGSGGDNEPSDDA